MRSTLNRSVWLPLLFTLVISSSAVTANVQQRAEIVHYVASHGDAYNEFLRERKAAFEALNPDIEVHIEIGAGNYTEAAQIRIATGVPTDVLDSTHSFMILANQGMLADLYPHMVRDRGGTDGEIVPFALGVLEQEGRLLGIPSQIYNIGVIYNRSLFDELGIEDPNSLGDAWNWDAVRDIGRKTTQDFDGDGIPDRHGIGISTSLVNLSPAVHQAGGAFFDSYLNPSQSLLQTDSVREGLGFYAELFRAGIAAGFSTDQLYARRGQALTLYGVAGNLPFIQDNGDDFEAALQPIGPANRRGGHTFFGPYHVPAVSNQQEAAYRWIAFLALTVESQAKLMQTTGRIPAYPDALLHMSEFVDPSNRVVYEFLLAFRDISMHPDNYPHTLTPAESAMSAVFNPGYGEVLRGEAPLEGFLETMQQLLQVELDRVNQP